MKFHVIGGLPRSGSTLLTNILNQNPRFYASSTSIMPQLLASLSHLFSNSPEIKGLLARKREVTEDRIKRTMQRFVEEWYACEPGCTCTRAVIFDKSRAWGHHALLLKQLFPDSKLLICVRDLREVFGSIEKQHRKNPLLDTAATPLEKTLYTRADQMFGVDGMIGGPLNGIEDLLRRKVEGTMFVRYELLAAHPQTTLESIYKHLGEEPFTHDLEAVENTADDVDALYLNKFPHEGSGKVVPPNPTEWKRFVSADLEKLIMGKCAAYNAAFGYN